MATYREAENPVRQSTELEESVEGTRQFLKAIIPFDSLSEPELTDIAVTMTWKRFSPGESIIKQGAPGENFYLIRSGLTKVYLLDDEGNETVLGFLGEADCFGEIALLTQGPTTANIQAVEQTLSLVQTKDAFLRMTHKHPVFYKFFNQLLTRRMRAVYKELLSENPGVAQVEPFLYRKQIKEMISSFKASVSPQTTLQEAARTIIEKGLTSVVVVDDQERPLGILRPAGILKSVLLEGAAPHAPAETVMEKDFHSIDAEGYFFDALYQMIRYRTNELIALTGEKTGGILTGFDLLRFRGREVLSPVRNIEEAPTLSQLNVMRGEVERVLRALIADGALASHACKIVSEFNDKMVRRVIQLSEEECGPPPAPYAWLGLGSEGRKEQTLLTDQDNALVFSEGGSAEVSEYFKRLSARVVEGLHRCGIPRCKGGVMAENPKFFGDMAQWRTRTAGWIQTPVLQEKDLMDTYVFLDFRSVTGDPGIEKDLKSHVIQLTREHPAFLKSLAQAIVSIPIPIGFFKNFTVEKSGKYKNRLNLKLYGLVPLITCVKILALHQGIMETNTIERIRRLNQAKTISDDQAEILEQAFETFLTLKIRNNQNDIDQGRDLSNHIDPVELSSRQKQLLKEAFWAVSQLQKTTRNLLKVRGDDEAFRM
jgi:CBS domain-containing protein